MSHEVKDRAASTELDWILSGLLENSLMRTKSKLLIHFRPLPIVLKLDYHKGSPPWTIRNDCIRVNDYDDRVYKSMTTIIEMNEAFLSHLMFCTLMLRSDPCI